MNEELENFVKNLSFVSFGTILSTIFSFIYIIIAGRMLGPLEYGKYVIIQSIALVLIIPMLLGFNTAMIKYCAETPKYDLLRKIISTTYIIIIFLTGIFTIIYFLFSNQLASIFSVNFEMLKLSIIFAIFYVFYVLTTSTLQGLHQMKDFAIFQPIYGSILLFSFYIFLNFHSYSFISMVYATYLAYGVISVIIIIIFLKKFFILKIYHQWLSTAMSYSFLALIGGLAFTLYSNVDKILINYYLGVESVGIYGVYYYASFTFIGIFMGIFISVFFPTISRIADKKEIYRKLYLLFPYFIIIGIPITFCCEYIILQFLGKDYPIEFPLMFLFAITAIFVTWYSILAWFFNSDGINGVRLTISGTILIALVNLISNIWLIPKLGLHGAVGSSIIAFTFGIFYNHHLGKKYFIDS